MKAKLMAYAHADRSMANKIRVVSAEQIVQLRQHVTLECGNRGCRGDGLKSFPPLRLITCSSLFRARLQEKSAESAVISTSRVLTTDDRAAISKIKNN